MTPEELAAARELVAGGTWGLGAARLMATIDALTARVQELEDQLDAAGEQMVLAGQIIDRLTEERDRLRAERDREVQKSDLISQCLHRDRARAERAEAENARLREALDLIANTGMDARMCMVTARAALSPTEASHD